MCSEFGKVGIDILTFNRYNGISSGNEPREKADQYDEEKAVIVNASSPPSYILAHAIEPIAYRFTPQPDRDADAEEMIDVVRSAMHSTTAYSLQAEHARKLYSFLRQRGFEVY